MIDQLLSHHENFGLPEGDFDDGGLRLNLAARGCYFDLLQGADHQDAIVQVGDSSKLAVFNGDHAMGLILHQPNPRHWIAIVRPAQATHAGEAAWLCDSLVSCVFVLSVEELQDFIGHMAVAQSEAAQGAGEELDRMMEITAWSAYKVHR